jgi:hypothetical protein
MQLSYPATRYHSVPFADITSKDERERLSGSALRGFFRLVEHWRLRDQDSRQLLGGIANGRYYAMKRHPGNRVLDTDELLRISYLLGIFEALNKLHGLPLADDWISLPNTNRIFAGRSPLEYMLRGGPPAMHIVRRLLDSRQEVLARGQLEVDAPEGGS